MIVVRVELHSAITGKIKEIGRMIICNEGVNESGSLGDYSGKVMRKPNFETVTRDGTVLKHQRLALPVWVLVRKMLEKMGY